MAEEGRALMTEREREIIAGDADVTSNYKYKVQSLVRNRVRKHFDEDLEVLEEEFPEVYEMIVDNVCGGEHIDPEDPDLEQALDGLIAAVNYAEETGLNDVSLQAAALYQELGKEAPEEDWDVTDPDQILDELGLEDGDSDDE